MIKLSDILQAAINKLDNKFDNEIAIYTDKSEQDLEVPAVFLSVFPIQREMTTKYVEAKRIALYFDYIHGSEDQLEILEVLEAFHEVFQTVFEVKDRKLFIWDKKADYNLLSGDRFFFSFKLDFSDGIEIDKVYGYYPAELMRELNMTIDKRSE